MRKILLSLIAFGFAAAAHAQAIGPVYPAPGGSSYSGSGNLGAGTLVGTYSGFDLNATDHLYWGANSIQLAMDGAINSPGETLTYSAVDSNLAGGIAVYLGSTVLYQNNSPTPVTTRYTVSLTDLSNSAIAFDTDSTTLGIVGAVFPLFEVTGAFKATQTLTANGTAYSTFFNNALYKSPTPGQLQSSITRSFYYTDNVPEPATWAMMVIGFGAIGFTARRKRSAALLA